MFFMVEELGEMSKQFGKALEKVRSNRKLSDSLRYFAENPTANRSDDPNGERLCRLFGSFDTVKYAAWNIDPATADYGLAKADNKRADYERNLICRFCKKIVEEPKRIYRHKEYQKIYQLIGPVKRIRDLANMMNPHVAEFEKRRKSMEPRRISMSKARASVPEELQKYMGQSYELGSFF